MYCKVVIGGINMGKFNAIQINNNNNNVKLDTPKEPPKIKADTDNLADLLSKGVTTSKTSNDSPQLKNDLYEDMGFVKSKGENKPKTSMTISNKYLQCNESSKQNAELQNIIARMDSKDNVKFNSNRCDEGMEFLACAISQKEIKALGSRYFPGNPNAVPMSQETGPSGFSAGYKADGSDAKPQTMGSVHMAIACFCDKYDIDESWTWQEALGALVEESVEYIIVQHDGNPNNIEYSHNGEYHFPEQISEWKKLVSRRIDTYLKAHGYASVAAAKADLVSKGLGKTGNASMAFIINDGQARNIEHERYFGSGN